MTDETIVWDLFCPVFCLKRCIVAGLCEFCRKYKYLPHDDWISIRQVRFAGILFVPSKGVGRSWGFTVFREFLRLIYLDLICVYGRTNRPGIRLHGEWKKGEEFFLIVVFNNWVELDLSGNQPARFVVGGTFVWEQRDRRLLDYFCILIIIFMLAYSLVCSRILLMLSTCSVSISVVVIFSFLYWRMNIRHAVFQRIKD